ncbi:MAG: methylated-DNA--[protein]-cysteine S-methyltransferase [Burkholderiaceae bacterium]
MNPLIAQARGETPLGLVTLAATEQGLAGLWFEGQKHHPGVLDAPVDAGNRWIVQALAELQGYWSRSHARFAVPLDLRGTPFQRSVWQALTRIEAGATRSYGALAAQLGCAAAVRAVGAAVGRNPVSVIVPCHRVIGSDGALTGYAGGLDRKVELLRLEGAWM